MSSYCLFGVMQQLAAIAWIAGWFRGGAFGIFLMIIGMLRFYRFVDSWVPSRTIGTLGIIIAGSGVLGEAYQFTALVLM